MSIGPGRSSDLSAEQNVRLTGVTRIPVSTMSDIGNGRRIAGNGRVTLRTVHEAGFYRRNHAGVYPWA